MAEEAGLIRIGDKERASAMTALGEHMSEGRLDIEEYGQRSASVTTAKTRADLTAIFADLPDPHPVLGTAVATRKSAPVATVLPYLPAALFIAGGAAIIILSAQWIVLYLLFVGPMTGAMTKRLAGGAAASANPDKEPE